VSDDNGSRLRLLPAVERVLNSPRVLPLSARHGRAVVTAWVRNAVNALRNGPANELPDDAAAVEELVVERVEASAKGAASERLRKVINGTGIVIHTNLGRAPLAPLAIQAMVDAAECTNVEVDLGSGVRGRRGAAVEELCRGVTGAEAALVVNNCAAATLLTLQTLGAGREVVISRGQLIEIGGSFRLPDVFKQAGVRLHEVGTTNRTRIADYANAIGEETAALLRVHPSNFRVTGFCESVEIAELVKLGKQRDLPVIDDVGSGCLEDLTAYGLPYEPVVGASIEAGADVVLFSGDKLLGGTQCGIIVGRSAIIERLRANPLARALRVDKLTLAALQGTLAIHRSGRALQEIPVLRQLTMSVAEIRPRAEKLLERLRTAESSNCEFSIEAVDSAPGGGSMPDLTLPSWAIGISSPDPEGFARRLRTGDPAVFSRVRGGKTMVDLRTVLPGEEETLLRCILTCLRV
jgi:L-seryl-tRNA(Ser) seleniumtransferase